VEGRRAREREAAPEHAALLAVVGRHELQGLAVQEHRVLLGPAALRLFGGADELADGALAHHWRDAGDFERAIAQLTRAAEQAERGWAKDRAIDLYREALGLLPEDDKERRKAITRKLAVAHQAHFHVQDAQLLGLSGPED